MDRHFQALPLYPVGDNPGFRRPTQPQAARVTLESPALDVMTDLVRASPATIRPQAPVEGAKHFMISRGVRLLLVVDDRESVLGVLTSTDVLGEKAMRVAIDRGLKRSELIVDDLMTPVAQVEALAFAEVEAARVGHILETLRSVGRQHVLVVDLEVLPPKGLIDRPVNRTMVRGIFSISQLARQLGVALPSTGEVAHNFSEIETALGH